MNRFFQRSYHLGERIVRESKALPKRWRVFGPKVALATFRDGLTPPGKSPRYVNTIQEAVNRILMPLVEEYQTKTDEAEPLTGKIPVWCCWWQGVEQMPELVKMCHTRLKQRIPPDKAELHIITLDNYQDYVTLPDHIIDKFNRKIITMTTMSDILRFALLEKYGGYWLDATVFFAEEIPEQYLSGELFCRRNSPNSPAMAREACKGNWCGFSLAGPKHSIVFRFMNDAFSRWWAEYDTIIDYVLIDYMLMTGFRLVPQIHEAISSIPTCDDDIFAMYKVLNEPYSPELLERLNRRNTVHKLTYKMDLYKETPDGKQTLYGYLLEQVHGER